MDSSDTIESEMLKGHIHITDWTFDKFVLLHSERGIQILLFHISDSTYYELLFITVELNYYYLDLWQRKEGADKGVQ